MGGMASGSPSISFQQQQQQQQPMNSAFRGGQQGNPTMNKPVVNGAPGGYDPFNNLTGLNNGPHHARGGSGGQQSFNANANRPSGSNNNRGGGF